MKILGIGIDLVKIDRIEKILEKSYKLRFLTKVLHPKELERFQEITNREYQAQFVASRWAAKEATVKAMGRRELVFAETHIAKDINGIHRITQASPLFP
jgi:holo-[acyl-carrier protein] synthase